MTDLVASTTSAAQVARRFSGLQRLTVRQRRKWLEVLLSFEMKNAYDVYDEDQTAVLKVAEQGEGVGAFLARMFLGPMRPFTAAVVDANSGEALLVLKRRWAWFFPKLEVYSGAGESIGVIQKRWSWIRRIYAITDDTGRTVAELFGPFFKPWTFEIRSDGMQVGMIQKRWSGLGREMFTDADNFGVDLTSVADPKLKALAFAATVLIDVVHFERSKQ